jgi:predicted Zn-dependent peptidase
MMRLTVLANGLRVASRAMPGAETAAVGLHAETGSRHEPAALNGIAHLFEHMVFKGAGGRSAREISEAIEDVGGDLNASTDRDSTLFSASVLPEHVALGVELLADMIARPHFDAAELEREKDVVLQELAESRDTPSDIIFDDLQGAAFPDQPIGRPILGGEESIAAIGTDDLFAWRDGQYRAGAMALVAAGKVDHEALVALAEARLGDLPPGTAQGGEAACFAGGSRVGRARCDQAHLALGFAGPAALDPAFPAARLFAEIAGGGSSSRLFQQLREERGLAYSVGASLSPWQDAGLLSVYAATARSQCVAAAALIEEVLGECAERLDARELRRAKTQARAQLLMWLESPWGQANYLARTLAVHGRLVEVRELVDRFEAVSLEEVRAAGRAMLSGPRARATIGFPRARAA